MFLRNKNCAQDPTWPRGQWGGGGRGGYEGRYWADVKGVATAHERGRGPTPWQWTELLALRRATQRAGRGGVGGGQVLGRRQGCCTSPRTHAACMRHSDTCMRRMWPRRTPCPCMRGGAWGAGRGAGGDSSFSRFEKWESRVSRRTRCSFVKTLLRNPRGLEGSGGEAGEVGLRAGTGQMSRVLLQPTNVAGARRPGNGLSS
jgi:hypothetical protein